MANTTPTQSTIQTQLDAVRRVTTVSELITALGGTERAPYTQTPSRAGFAGNGVDLFNALHEAGWGVLLGEADVDLGFSATTPNGNGTVHFFGFADAPGGELLEAFDRVPYTDDAVMAPTRGEGIGIGPSTRTEAEDTTTEAADAPETAPEATPAPEVTEATATPQTGTQEPADLRDYFGEAGITWPTVEGYALTLARVDDEARTVTVIYDNEERSGVHFEVDYEPDLGAFRFLRAHVGNHTGYLDLHHSHGLGVLYRGDFENHGHPHTEPAAHRVVTRYSRRQMTDYVAELIATGWLAEAIARAVEALNTTHDATDAPETAPQPEEAPEATETTATPQTGTTYAEPEEDTAPAREGDYPLGTVAVIEMFDDLVTKKPRRVTCERVSTYNLGKRTADMWQVIDTGLAWEGYKFSTGEVVEVWETEDETTEELTPTTRRVPFAPIPLAIFDGAKAKGFSLKRTVVDEDHDPVHVTGLAYAEDVDAKGQQTTGKSLIVLVLPRDHPIVALGGAEDETLVRDVYAAGAPAADPLLYIAGQGRFLALDTDLVRDSSVEEITAVTARWVQRFEWMADPAAELERQQLGQVPLLQRETAQWIHRFLNQNS